MKKPIDRGGTEVETVDVEAMFADWGSPFVTRDDLPRLTGGIINRKTIRNADSLGKGIKGKFRVGHRKVAYKVSSVIEFLRERIKKNNPEKSGGSYEQ